MVEEALHTQMQDNLGADTEEVLPYKYSITAYGADYPVDGLVRRIADGSIFIPSFQRGFVWNLPKASRFVESLLLGLPVPGIFLSKEEETQKLLVIDGQQRLRTLQHFYEGVFADTGREFALSGVESRFKSATYKSLQDDDRRRLDDSILHATIVRQDEPSDDDSRIYHLFERLNTGGLLLNPQEIRACIYHGELNDLLRQLNANDSWRAVFGNVSWRMRDQELILRFFALYFGGHKYRRPMKEFLNKYMGGNRHLKTQSADELTRIFQDTIRIVHRSLGPTAFKPIRALNVAVFDAVMVGITRRLQEDSIIDAALLHQQYSALLANPEFLAATEKATADEESVRRRMRMAMDAFADAG